MFFNIILVFLCVSQIIVLLVITIIRNREIDKQIKKSDELLNEVSYYDFARPYSLMWSEWYQNQFEKKEIKK